MTTARPGRVLISEPELRTRIAELGRQIGHDYAGETPVLVGVLQGAFHPYYKNHRVLQDDRRLMFARLALCSAVGQVITNGLALLGVSAPETM